MAVVAAHAVPVVLAVEQLMGACPISKPGCIWGTALTHQFSSLHVHPTCTPGEVQEDLGTKILRLVNTWNSTQFRSMAMWCVSNSMHRNAFLVHMHCVRLQQIC